MEDMIERRVEGTYRTTADAKTAVKRLFDEGYQREEMLLIVNKASQQKNELDQDLRVMVDTVDAEDEPSLWDRIVETFTVDEEADYDYSLEQYGVREGNAERFQEALQANEIVLLVESGAPKQNGEISQVNEEVLENYSDPSNQTEESVVETETSQKVVFHSTSELNDNIQHQGGDLKMVDSKKDKTQNIDEVTSSESEAIKENEKGERKDEKPTDVETTETSKEGMKEMEENRDPGQAQSTREDDEIEHQTNPPQSDATDDKYGTGSTEDEGMSLESTPELTGDEETVEKDGSDHRYPENRAKGTVDGKENGK